MMALEKRRGRGWRKGEGSPIASFRSAFLSPAPIADARDRGREFDRKGWERASRESVTPFPCLLFRTPGGYAACQYLDAWAQVELVRRATLDGSAMPGTDGSTGIRGEGFSLPGVALKAMSVDRFLVGEDRVLAAAVWVDGWVPLQREVAYFAPDADQAREMARLERLLRELEKHANEDVHATAEIANVRTALRELREASIVVLGAFEPAPVGAKAEHTLIVRRWTAPCLRSEEVRVMVWKLVLSLAEVLGLGSTTPKALDAHAFDEGEG